MKPDNTSIQIYSIYDGWEIQVVDLNTSNIIFNKSWDHEDFEAGVGGEIIMSQVFKLLGFHVYVEEVC